MPHSVAFLFSWIAFLLLSASQVLAESPTPSNVSKETPQTVYLHTEFLPYEPTVKKGSNQCLARELARQALLIAVRDEFGLTARDGTLKETVPEGEVLHLALLERRNWKGKWQFKLFAFDPQDREHLTHGLWDSEPLWQTDFQNEVYSSKFYWVYVPVFEQATRKEFVEALKAVGLRALDVPRKPAELDTQAWEESLLEVDFPTQFGVVRAIHQAMREHGSTPELLGLLARGYANLSMLTQHQWNTTSEVFAARAMLYAERFLASQEEKRIALWHRAYVWALTGSHQNAERDFNAIQKLATNQDEDTELNDTEIPETDLTQKSPSADADPLWSQLIRPFFLFNPEKLMQVGSDHESLLPWSHRLQFQVISSYRYSEWLYKTGGLALAQIPTAYGIYAELAHHGGSLGGRRAGARYGPTAFTRFLPDSLNKIPDFPEALRAVLPIDRAKQFLFQMAAEDPNPDDDFSPLPQYVAKQLRKHSQQESSPGLSWSTLAYLLEEEMFLQVAHSLHVSTNATETSLEEDVSNLYPLVKNHRYAGYIESFRYNKQRQWEQYQSVLNDIALEDPLGQMSPLIYAMWRVQDSEGTDLGRHFWGQIRFNFTLQGMIDHLFIHGPNWNYQNRKSGVTLAKKFRSIAPHCEVATRMRISAATHHKREQLQKWEKKLKRDPEAFRSLGVHYEKQKDIESAIRCFRRSLDCLPTVSATNSLAAIYARKKDWEEWENTYRKFLDESKDTGLKHAAIHKTIAYEMIKRGLWQKARTHAETAGQTWSSWGLDAASHVTEGLAEWDASEEWVSAASRSYPTHNGINWYFWCCRTGRGDLEAAQELAIKYLDASPKSLTRAQYVNLGIFRLLEGSQVEALEAYHEALAVRPTLTCTCMVAQLSRELNDEKTRQKVIDDLKKFLGKKKNLRPVDHFGLELLELLEEGKLSDKRLAKLDDWLKQLAAVDRSAFSYFIGRECHALDKPKLANLYWRRSLTTPSFDYGYATLSGAELAEQFDTSRPDKPLGPDDIWPPLEEDDKKNNDKKEDEKKVEDKKTAEKKTAEKPNAEKPNDKANSSP